MFISGLFWRSWTVHYNINNKWRSLVAVIFIFFSSTSFAVGFGKIKVYSYLNEFLSAEIELLGVENIHTDLLIANLASSKDFVRANMARPFFLTKLSFELIRYEDQTVLYVSSTKPVKHPFLDFLVELSWPDGKLVKGYTILIDPPPKGNALANRDKSLKKRKALIADNTKFDSPESVEITGTSLGVKKNLSIMELEIGPKEFLNKWGLKIIR
jgi:Tfp pilus assembly protein FimV